jgi:hypothetical protein
MMPMAAGMLCKGACLRSMPGFVGMLPPMANASPHHPLKYEHIKCGILRSGRARLLAT